MNKEEVAQIVDSKMSQIIAVLKLPILLAVLFASHAYGYGENALKPIEGSGHSVFTVAVIWLLVNIANLGIVEEEFTKNNKLYLSLFGAACLELAPLVICSLSSVPSTKFQRSGANCCDRFFFSAF